MKVDGHSSPSFYRAVPTGVVPGFQILEPKKSIGTRATVTLDGVEVTGRFIELFASQEAAIARMDDLLNEELMSSAGTSAGNEDSRVQKLEQQAMAVLNRLNKLEAFQRRQEEENSRQRLKLGTVEKCINSSENFDSRVSF